MSVSLEAHRGTEATAQTVRPPFTRQALINLGAAFPPCPGMGVLPSTGFFTNHRIEKTRKVGWGTLASLGRAQDWLSLDNAGSLQGPAGWLLSFALPSPPTKKAICKGACLDGWKGPIVSKVQPSDLASPTPPSWAGVKAERSLTSQSDRPGPAPLRASTSIHTKNPGSSASF